MREDENSESEIQAAELANKAVNKVEITGEGKSFTITFDKDVNASKIKNAEEFLNEVLQFQVTRVHRVDNKPTKMTEQPYPAEANDLTATEVKTILAQGWGEAAIEWSKVKVAQGEANTSLVLTVEDELIDAKDLVSEGKINSTNAVSEDLNTGYKITFYQKGKTDVKYKLQLNTTADGATPTKTKFIKE